MDRRIYVVDGLGAIQVDFLERGDMTVKITYSDVLRDIVKPIVRGGERSWFNPKFMNWVVFEQFSDVVLNELECVSRRYA
jgi:hypothetical protein